MKKYDQLPNINDRGDVVLPAESGNDDIVKNILEKWGCDIIRDSDGTQLSEELLKLDLDVYSTICLVRADQQWAKDNKDKLHQKFLMSDFTTATSNVLEIVPLLSYSGQKYQIDTIHDPKEYWQVFNRTTGQEIDVKDWLYDQDQQVVVIKNTEPFCDYTVNFLVYQTWDSTSMYNHIINSWTCDRIVSVDPYHKEARTHLMEYFDKWLEVHPYTDVVRLTTLAYHFVVDADEQGKDKFRDWTGYADTISIEALEDFYKEYGYRLTSEDFVDQGYYNVVYRNPNSKYKDWIDFIHRFVIGFGKELVDKIHAAGKKAAIFQGDHWVGVEPYSDKFSDMGIDINIGACENGIALRRLADSKNDEIKEIRLYPYFFPDVFKESGDPISESIENWVKIRRAMLRTNVDRIGYGGYLSLAAKFPDFVDHIANLCSEFRTIKAYSKRTKAYTAGIKVAVLNSWGRSRAWLENFGKDQKFLVKRPDVVAVAGSILLESLSGLPVEVEFLSFDDIKANGVPDDIDVIINDGHGGSSWSGDAYWNDKEIVCEIKNWIYKGGGFLGCTDPSAFDCQGRYFQLRDVMGVEKEIGKTVMTNSCQFDLCDNHFITKPFIGNIDLGVDKSYVFPVKKTTQVLLANALHVLVAANSFGVGRAVYLASLPFSLENAKLLHRAIFWAANKESCVGHWSTSNLNTDCSYYPETNILIVLNNVEEKQQTKITDFEGNETIVNLYPYQMKCFKVY